MSTSMLQDVPTNVPRRDNLLADAIWQTLQESGHEFLRSVQIAVRDGCVLLRGCVPRYYHKQLAQCAAMKVPGITAVDNRLEVL